MPSSPEPFCCRHRIAARQIFGRVCHALGPIANITTGVLLANNKAEQASVPLIIAVSVSVLIGLVDSSPGHAKRPQASRPRRRNGARPVR